MEILVPKNNFKIQIFGFLRSTYMFSFWPVKDLGWLTLGKPWFLRVCCRSLLKTLWEKQKLLVTSNFSISHGVFYPFGWTFCYFHQVLNCRLLTLSVWKSLKFVVWERVKVESWNVWYKWLALYPQLLCRAHRSSVGKVHDLRKRGLWFNSQLGRFLY